MKNRVGIYTFDASGKTITFGSPVSLDGILLVTNVTENVIIYNPFKIGFGGSVIGAILSLDFDTSSMNDTDKLLIEYDDAVVTVGVTAAALPLPSGAATSVLQGGGLPAALGVGGGLKIDGSGTALPVSGAMTMGVAVDAEGGGKVAVGLTAVEVTFTGTTRIIIIQADASNSGTLYVGKSTVTSAGANALAVLAPGDSISLNYNDASQALYVCASVAAQNFWKGALLA